jgi:hypothetical protein
MGRMNSKAQNNSRIEFDFNIIEFLLKPSSAVKEEKSRRTQ